MKVKGLEIPKEVIDACLAVMKGKRFRALDIAIAAQEAGMPIGAPYYGLCNGIADRLIQKERQSKQIIMSDRFPYWRPVNG